MRCRFIQVHDAIEQIQIRITFLKGFCILLQYFNCYLRFLCKISIRIHHWSIFLFSYLNDIFIECLFLIAGIFYLLQIIFFSPVLTLLRCIIIHKRLPKTFLICLFQRFLHINSVPRCPFGYHIFADKISVVVCQMPFPFGERNRFCSQLSHLLSSVRALNAAV